MFAEAEKQNEEIQTFEARERARTYGNELLKQENGSNYLFEKYKGKAI